MYPATQGNASQRTASGVLHTHNGIANNRESWYNRDMKLLHFTAEWCQPCKAMKPIIDEYVEANPDIEYAPIDIDYDFDSLTKYDVQGVPTFILLNEDAEVNRHTGAMPKQDFLEFMAG